MVDAVARAAGAAPRVVWRPSLDSDPSVLAPDLQRSRLVLGYLPQVSIEDGIAMQLAEARNGH
jgi:nucleoside-diphosphate-sugar epimerase